MGQGLRGNGTWWDWDSNRLIHSVGQGQYKAPQREWYTIGLGLIGTGTLCGYWERTGEGLSGTWDSMVMVLGHRWPIPHEAAVRVYVYMQMWCLLLTADFQAICLFVKT